VLQVRKKDNKKIYAMKVLNKKSIIEKSEVDHTKAEQSILQKLCHPFLVNLNYSFQTPDKLYFIMDYINGGELFFHLQNDKKFPEDRVRFYAAEIVCGLEYLHSAGVLYRDLKPENILLTSDGHICMTDFGISKEGLHSDDDRTATFCGTPEYLAPEVLEGNGYGKAVDWWSFGTLVFEMLTGLPPFYAQDVQQMYAKIISAKLVIPSSVGPEARALIEELLVRQPEKRLSEPSKIKAHPFFRGIDWDMLVRKELTPPYIPPVKNAEDTSQIDSTFTQEEAALSHEDPSAISDADQANFSGFAYTSPNAN
jgi:serine/threonine protein kinase